MKEYLDKRVIKAAQFTGNCKADAKEFCKMTKCSFWEDNGQDSEAAYFFEIHEQDEPIGTGDWLCFRRDFKSSDREAWVASDEEFKECLEEKVG